MDFSCWASSEIQIETMSFLRSTNCLREIEGQMESKQRWSRGDFQTNVCHVSHETHQYANQIASFQALRFQIVSCYTSLKGPSVRIGPEKSTFETVLRIKSEGNKAKKNKKTKTNYICHQYQNLYQT